MVLVFPSCQTWCSARTRTVFQPRYLLELNHARGMICLQRKLSQVAEQSTAYVCAQTQAGILGQALQLDALVFGEHEPD